MKHYFEIIQFLSLGVVCSMLISCAPKQEEHKEIGIQLYSARDDMKKDPKATVAKIGDMGYTFVEAAGYADGKFYGMSPEAFTQMVEDNGMLFTSSHTGQALPDSANWEKTMTWWDECIAAHKAAGVKYIVQPWMGEEGYASLDGLQAYCDYFNAVGEKCADQGILFGYHNHAKEFTTELDGNIVYDYMLQHTDPAKVFFQLDLYWIAEGGKSAVDYFNDYPGRFTLWHVKDEAELGASGQMDFRPVFENSGKAGMEKIIVEVEEYNFEPLVSIQKSLDYLINQDYVN